MHFILAPGNIAKFAHLRQKYEEEKHVVLDVEPSRLGVPTFFGGTDVVRRNKQVAFLEKMYAILKMHLLKEEHITTDLERQLYVIASRAMIAACLYVQIQIGNSKRNSALYRIIEDSLGINAENFLDDEDKEACFLTAKRLFLSTDNSFEVANILLIKEELQPFSEREWDKFSKFLVEICPKKADHNQYTNFPVISITQPLFGTAFSYVGATVGVVLAEGISNSTSAIGPRVQLTALIGSTLLILSPAGTTGAALFAPMIATKLLNSFCTISIGHVMGTAAKFLGQGVGISVGLPFDLAYNILWSVCSVISHRYSKESQYAAIDGIRLFDGTMIIAGIPLQLISDHEMPAGYTKKVLQITDQGEIHIDGEEIINPHAPMQLPEEVLSELERQSMNVGKSQQDIEINQESAAAVSL